MPIKSVIEIDWIKGAPIAVNKAFKRREEARGQKRRVQLKRKMLLFLFFPSCSPSPRIALPGSSVAPVFLYKSYDALL